MRDDHRSNACESRLDGRTSDNVCFFCFLPTNNPNFHDPPNRGTGIYNGCIGLGNDWIKKFCLYIYQDHKQFLVAQFPETVNFQLQEYYTWLHQRLQNNRLLTNAAMVILKWDEGRNNNR